MTIAWKKRRLAEPDPARRRGFRPTRSERVRRAGLKHWSLPAPQRERTRAFAAAIHRFAGTAPSSPIDAPRGASDGDPHNAGKRTPSSRRVRTKRLIWLTVAGLAAGVLLTGPHAAAVEVSSLPSHPSFELPEGQGRVLRFDEAVDSVFVADTTVADVRVLTPLTAYVYGKKTGATNLIAVSADQKVEASVEFRVTLDPREANRSRRELDPSTRSTLDITLFGRRAALKGNARTIEEAVDAESVAQSYSPPGQPPINNSTIAGSQQINIRVRFAEVSRTDLHLLGLDWQQILDSVNVLFQNVGNDAIVEGMRRNGLITILAEPNLTAVTGQTASSFAGDEIPLPVVTGPNSPVSFQRERVGVSLEFTPTLIRSNRIALHVHPEVSAFSQIGAVQANGFNIPALSVRTADSTIEMASGETFAMAGLFQRQLMPDGVERFPVLGYLPVLGALWQSERYRRNESELVILVTPYLVKPVRDRNVATPLDRPAPPPAPATVATTRPGLILK
jgi:pilus assembly protein CpaC